MIEREVNGVVYSFRTTEEADEYMGAVARAISDIEITSPLTTEYLHLKLGSKNLEESTEYGN